ncbi:MAG: hypothetical protein AB8B55_21085 [Mariniblastus sp.]
MSDLRYDPINDQWVSIASRRRDRPIELVPVEQTLQRVVCPFCAGNEEETPSALAIYDSHGRAISSENEGPWTVRVVPNKFPSFSSKTESSKTESSKATSSSNETTATERASASKVDAVIASNPYQVNCDFGIQELIIPSPRHLASLSELSDNELKVSFKAYQDRIAEAKTLEYVKHAMLFMNCRSAAGATLGHIHSQLIGSPIVSSGMRRRVERQQNHFDENGCSLIGSVTDWEIEQQARIVKLSENFCVVCPFASKFPFQTWIIPLNHRNDFLKCPDAMRDELASHCRSIVKQMESVLEEPSYNMLFHLDPFNRISSEGQDCWYVEVFPRLTRAAGYEWGTDIWVNPVLPEFAARRLREQE